MAIKCDKCGCGRIGRTCRTKCIKCKRKLCRECMGRKDHKYCPDCAKKLVYVLETVRIRDRWHDTIMWAFGGLRVAGRLVRAGKPLRESYRHRTGRRGVDATYVDSQYHGRLDE